MKTRICIVYHQKITLVILASYKENPNITNFIGIGTHSVENISIRSMSQEVTLIFETTIKPLRDGLVSHRSRNTWTSNEDYGIAIRYGQKYNQ
jgi:hypothetical protein